MAFDWASQKEGWGGKLKMVGLGTVGGNAPANETIESLGETINVIQHIANEGCIEERRAGPEFTVSASAGSGNAYVLPWKANSAVSTQLGQSYEIFVTSQLNGCAVFVGGEPAAPIVFHANAQPGYTSDGMPDSPSAIRKFDVETRLPRWDSYYGAVAQKLSTIGRLPTKNVGTLLPGQYMENGDAAVFGVREAVLAGGLALMISELEVS